MATDAERIKQLENLLIAVLIHSKEPLPQSLINMLVGALDGKYHSPQEVLPRD